MALDKKEIQRLIREFIEENEMSLEAFAGMLGDGSGKGKVSAWVNGEYAPRPATIDRMIDLGVLPDAAGKFRNPEAPAVPSSAIRVIDQMIAETEAQSKAHVARLKQLRKELARM